MLLAAFRHAWRDLSRFKSIDRNQRSIVFYAQDVWAWKHLGPIVERIVSITTARVCYVTSNRRDPVLLMEDERIQAFYVGYGAFRTSWFQSLEADVLVMTMPDFGNYHIKRSKHPVHYIYVHHSMVSSHMAYKPNAFDNFDSILCVGPHHHDEIRAYEKLKKQSPKSLLKAGYGVVDTILAKRTITADHQIQSKNSAKNVLIAPSWGENGLIETYGKTVIEVLLAYGHCVTIRPHYMTIRDHPKLLRNLRKEFISNPNFYLDTDLKSQGTVDYTDIMISDWSGAALEYAVGLERPVLFIDMPAKVNNPDYMDIDIEPVEIGVRSQIGEVIPLDQLYDIPAAINRLCENPLSWRDQILKVRSRLMYNIGGSASISAEYIANVASKSSTLSHR